MEFDPAAIGAVITILTVVVTGLGGAVVILYGKWKSAQHEAAKGDVAVHAMQQEADAKYKRGEADFEDAETRRVIDYWRSANAELAERYRVDISGLKEEVRLLAAELEKRNVDYVKCQIEKAGMAVELGHLEKKIDELHEEKKELLERISGPLQQVKEMEKRT